VHLVGVIKKKFITMRGHMDVKNELYFNILRPPFINHIHNIEITNKMHFKVYGIFYSLCSHQHVSANYCGHLQGDIIITRIQPYKCG